VNKECKDSTSGVATPF